MMKKYSCCSLLVFVLLFARLLPAQNVADNSSGQTGIVLEKQTDLGLTAGFSLHHFSFNDKMVDGKPMKQIRAEGIFLPNDEGAPDLPSIARYIALPEGATAQFEIQEIVIDTISKIDIAPAAAIPLDTDPREPELVCNSEIYNRDAWYPEQPVTLSGKTEIRGVDVMMLGVAPFQYNPVKKTLKVVREIKVNITFSGGSGTYGEERLRSRWFDPVLNQTLLNFESLPPVDFSRMNTSPKGTEDSGYEYLIIIPDDPGWRSYAEQVRDFRVKQGISTGIFSLSDIGGSTAEELEDFFDNAYANWSTPPVAVLLMADYGTDPVNSIISPMWNYYCVSDNIYADVNYNQMPDIIFARMTARNTSELQVMVSKMIDYETNPPADVNFYQKPITALGWQTERWFQLCSEAVGGYWREKTDKTPVRINDIFEGTPGMLWSTATNTSMVVDYFGPSGTGYIPQYPSQLGGWQGGNATMIAAAVNDGAFVLIHRDHGYEYGWGEPGFTNADINNLHNTQNHELPFVFSINCLTGKYNITGECFAEKFHRYTYNGLNAGALGVVAPSETSYSFVNDVFVWGMFDFFYPDFLPGYGPYVNGDGMLPAFGNAAGKYFLQQSQWPYNTGNKEATYNLFHHHGGAFMQVYNELPQPLTVTCDTTIYSWQDQISILTDPGAFIALSSGGEIFGTAESAGKTLIIPFDPMPAGTMVTLTITKPNFLRYEKNMEVVAPHQAYITLNNTDVDDSGALFPNGRMEYGETVALNITLENTGLSEAEDVDLSLITEDPWIDILNDSAAAGTLAPGETAELHHVFSIHADPGIPDGHMVLFSLAMQSPSGEWQSEFSITACAPAIEISQYVVHDENANNNGILEAGETAMIEAVIKNRGQSKAYSLSGYLTTESPFISIDTALTLPIGDLDTSQSFTTAFNITAAGEIPQDDVAEVFMHFQGDYALAQSDTLTFDFTGYCIPHANCSYGDGFSGFSLMEINNMDNGCSEDGYGDFTGMTALLEPGNSYEVGWKSAFSGQRACLWIDLNSNKVFEASELLVEDFLISAANTVFTTIISLPAEVQPGNKRLRIRAQWQNASSDPCADFSYGETEDYTVDIGGEAPETQVLNIPGGWSGISGYLVPQNPSLPDLFAPFGDDVIFMTNNNGFYWPEQNVNTLIAWDSHSGYIIKADGAITLEISGSMVSPAAVQLTAGWNLVPVLSPVPVSVTELFGPNLPSLAVVKEVAGFGIYWDDFGINTLTNLLPGKSYLILVNQDMLLQFPPAR